MPESPGSAYQVRKTRAVTVRRYYFFTISAYIGPVTQYQLWPKLAVPVVMTLVSYLEQADLEDCMDFEDVYERFAVTVLYRFTSDDKIVLNYTVDIL